MSSPPMAAEDKIYIMYKCGEVRAGVQTVKDTKLVCVWVCLSLGNTEQTEKVMFARKTNL